MNPAEALKIAYEKMQQYGLLEKGWHFEFDRAKLRFGRCYHRQKLITLSGPLTLVNTVEQVTDTILHEIAHALTPGHGHNTIWQLKACEVGATPQRCYSYADVIQPKGIYTFECPNCHKRIERYRKTKRNYACGRCCKIHSNGKFDPRFILRPLS